MLDCSSYCLTFDTPFEAHTLKFYTIQEIALPSQSTQSCISLNQHSVAHNSLGGGKLAEKARKMTVFLSLKLI